MTLRNRSWLVPALLTLWANPAFAESTFDRELELLRQLLDVKPGSVIADIGAGTGKYAIALSNAVGKEGRVYATELGAEEREDIAKAAAEAGARQLVVEEAQIASTSLPPASCDAVFLRGVYHHLTEPGSFGADLFATIRPGGRLVVIDFPPTPWLWLWTPTGIPGGRGGHGIRPELLVQELEAAGFVRSQTVLVSAKHPALGQTDDPLARVAEDRLENVSIVASHVDRLLGNPGGRPAQGKTAALDPGGRIDRVGDLLEVTSMLQLGVGVDPRRVEHRVRGNPPRL